MQLYHILATAVHIFCELIIWAMIIQAVLSWFVRDMHSGLAKFYMGLTRFTEPFVAPCRKLLYRLNINTGIFDFSLLVAFLFIEIIERVVIRLLGVILL